MKIFLSLVCISFTLLSVAQQNALITINETIEKPKNIILLIGDGTGLSQISASQYFNDDPSNFDRFPVVGLIKTSASNSLITDSAAGATAFASGVKTYNGAIGVGADSVEVATLVEHISKRGYATGVIATSSIVHATPACFYAHSLSRRHYEDIAVDLVNSDIDFFAGGGLKFFHDRSDGKDLLNELRLKGFRVETSILESVTHPKQAFLLANDAMPTIEDGRGNFLVDATNFGLQQLTREDDGFFLMVEGSQIDWGGHANNSSYLISELIDFDKAIGAALDFAMADGETLVIVTADHETGGFTLSSKDGDYDKIEGTFSTGGHSGTMVPVFSYGPGSEQFGGIYENTEIYHKMMNLLAK